MKRNYNDIINKQVFIVDDILTRYTQDEAGESQKQKFNDMSVRDKISLLTNTMLSTNSYEDFETSLVINFDMGNY